MFDLKCIMLELRLCLRDLSEGKKSKPYSAVYNIEEKAN